MIIYVKKNKKFLSILFYLFSMVAPQKLHANDEVNIANKKEKISSSEDTLVVKGTYRPGEITEGSDSYTTSSASTSTKMDLSFRDTPQSTTVITRKRMDDLSIKNIVDVVKNTPGLYVSTANGAGRPGFMSRGFDANVMYEGFSTPWSSFVPSSQANTAIFDRIEITRGATGLVQGAGNPSAAINMIYKRPTYDSQAIASMGVGRWNNYSGNIDASGPLNDTATLRGRIVVDGQSSDTFRDNEKRRDGIVYGIVEADFSDKTSITLGGYHQNEYNNHFWYDLPISSSGKHLDLPRSTFTGNDWEYKKSKNTTVFSILKYNLNNNLTLKFSTLQNWRNVDLLGTATYRHSPDSINMYQYIWGPSDKNRSQNYDISISGHYDIIGSYNQFVAGVTKQKFNIHSNSFDYSPDTIENIDILNFNYHHARKPVKKGDYIDNTKIEQNSTYAATHIELTQFWKILLGGRLDWYHYNDEYPNGMDKYKINRNITKYAGTTYDIDKNHTLYISYTDIFKPQSSTGLNGKIIKPIVGKNYETGVKGEYFDSLLNTSISLYQVDQENRSRLIPDQTGCVINRNQKCYEASGLVRTKGIDFEIQGSITPLWEVGVGYTYSDTRYVKDGNANNIGKRFSTDSPLNLFKLSSMYKFDGSLSNWRVGVNSYWQSAIYNEVNIAKNKETVINKQKPYAITDIIFGYSPTSQLDVQINITNIFDKIYYSSIGGSTLYGTEAYGEPRSFNIQATYRF